MSLELLLASISEVILITIVSEVLAILSNASWRIIHCHWNCAVTEFEPVTDLIVLVYLHGFAYGYLKLLEWIDY